MKAALKARGESPEWDDDEFALSGYEVGVRQLWEDRNGGQGRDLPLKMDACNIGQLKKGLKLLCLKGGPCWPGWIEPLKAGQSYGIHFNLLGGTESKWLAVVGIPESAPCIPLSVG